MIPYGRQSISEEDITSVVEVLKSDFLTQGPKVPLFEQTISEFVGSKFAVAVNSATSALHIACLALDVGEGDIVWTTPITFVASANCALYCGAEVDFVDIEPNTFNISVSALEIKLQQAKDAGRLPKALIAVHMCGRSPDMRLISQLSEEYGFHIIEDASHAIGADYLGEPVGSCRYSDITVFSFHPVKIVTTAEGGVVTTNDPDIAHKLQLLRSHGVTRDPTQLHAETHGPWYYEQVDLGWNYRMTELQAALGVSQLQRLAQFVNQRRVLAKQYYQKLGTLPLDLPAPENDGTSAWHLFVVRVKDASKRRAVFEALRQMGIGVNVHYIPVHLQPYYRKLGFVAGDYPDAEQYYQRAISIPLFHGMTDEQQDSVVAALTEALQ